MRGPIACLTDKPTHKLSDTLGCAGKRPQGKGHAFLDFGGHYPNQIFTGFVPAQNVATVGGQKFLESLAGKPVTLSGRIELYKGRPEIVISSPSQIVKE